MKEKIVKLWWFLFALSFLLGEIGSFKTSLFLGRPYHLHLLEVLLIFLFPLALKWLLNLEKEKSKDTFFILAIVVLLITLIDSWQLFHFQLGGLLYWLRWLVCWVDGFYLLYHPPSVKWLKGLSWSFIILSVGQYLFFNKISFYNPGNWDPHHYRLFGNLFDPNFYGLILFFFFAFWDIKKKNLEEKILALFFLFLLFFTFSRSAYLLLAFYFLISLTKKQMRNFKKEILLISLAVLVIGIMAFTLPGEGVKIWRLSTLYGLLSEDSLGWQIFSRHPLLGIGFNNIGLYKLRFLFLNPLTHSLGWFSSVFLNILVTTGLLGLIFWGVFLFLFYQQLSSFSRWLLLFFIFHSFFHNSFFYPFTLMVFFLIAGIMERQPS